MLNYSHTECGQLNTNYIINYQFRNATGIKMTLYSQSDSNS